MSNHASNQNAHMRPRSKPRASWDQEAKNYTRKHAFLYAEAGIRGGPGVFCVVYLLLDFVCRFFSINCLSNKLVD